MLYHQCDSKHYLQTGESVQHQHCCCLATPVVKKVQQKPSSYSQVVVVVVVGRIHADLTVDATRTMPHDKRP